MTAPLNRIKLLYAIIEDNLGNVNAEQLDWKYQENSDGFMFGCGIIKVEVLTKFNLIRLICTGYKNHIEDDLKLFLEDKNLTI